MNPGSYHQWPLILKTNKKKTTRHSVLPNSSTRHHLLLLLFSCLVLPDSIVTPWTVAHQAPLSMVFPRQEYWKGLPFPSPGDLPNPGIELASSALTCGFVTTVPPGKPVGPIIHGYLSTGKCYNASQSTFN